jgi:hypothetical protein
MSEALNLLAAHAGAYAKAFVSVRAALVSEGMGEEEADMEARSTVTTAMLVPDEDLMLEGFGLEKCPLCGKESY